MSMVPLRLKPGQDLKIELENFIRTQNITSGFVATCVGSLHQVTLRMAGAKPDKQDIRTYEGHFEIVSLVGTLSQQGVHLHLSVSNEEGEVIGGHLKEGSLVTTTAEIIIGFDPTITFVRRMDPDTGFEELAT